MASKKRKKNAVRRDRVLAFEQAVYRRDRVDALNKLIELLRATERPDGFSWSDDARADSNTIRITLRPNS